LVSENGAQPKGCRRNTTERGRGCLSCFRGNATRDCRGRAPDRGHTAVAVGGRAWETQRKRKQMLVSLTKQRTQRSANWDAKQRGKIYQTPLAQCRTGGRPPCANEYISFFAAAAQGEGGATAAQSGIRNGGPRWNRWIRCAGPGGVGHTTGDGGLSFTKERSATAEGRRPTRGPRRLGGRAVIRGMLQRAEQRGRWQGWGGPKALAEGATKNMSRGRRKHRDFAAGKSGMSESAQGGAGKTAATL
jgi:hypothetical protein